MRRKAIYMTNHIKDSKESLPGFLLGFIKEEGTPKAIFEFAEVGKIELVNINRIILLDQQTIGTTNYNQEGPQ
jgi:hypothetical protein